MAVIDVGSNTIHLLVADCSAGCVRPVHDRHVRAGLGTAVAEGAPLGPDRIRAAASVVRTFAAEAREHHARDIMVFGTHAVRAAPDQALLIQAIEREAGVTVRVLSSEQEAIWGVAGAMLGPSPTPPFLCADIGGGSCDLAAVGVLGVRRTASVPVGSGVLAARDLAGDPPSEAHVDRVATSLHEAFAGAGSLGPPDFPEIVVMGGAVRRFRQQVSGEPGAAALPKTVLLETVSRLLRTPSAAWPHAVAPERAALVRAGGMILRAIVVRWQVRRWRVSPYGVREGALVCRARDSNAHAAGPPDQPVWRPHGEEDASGHRHV